MTFKTLDDLKDIVGQTVLVRVDFNVPVQNGEISDITRLKAALPTIRMLQDKQARIALFAHFGRPKGERIADMSLAPIAEAFSEVLGQPVVFCEDCIGDKALSMIKALPEGGVIVLENTRFYSGEDKHPEGAKTGDPEFAKALAKLGDIYVNDAFSAAHRAHASTALIADILPAYAGRAMQKELEALTQALGNPERPVMGIVGGSKVSTKLDLLQNLIGKLDKLVIGGGMANTFLYAQGHDVGASLCEKDLADTARAILAKSDAAQCEIILPQDVVTAKSLKADTAHKISILDDIASDDMIFDIGPDSIEYISTQMQACKTLIWNGPVGVFEIPPFDQGTKALARQAADLAKAGAIAAIAGGGDTVAALGAAGVTEDFTYVSTAGGAFLEWMEGKALPGVEALKS